ncbi:MAG: hypothetical protein JKX85_14560 [Phycisphaeraceae bacterium]|nr:hypothetical protein [Phycisphaeraceae bacterium]
MRHTVVEKSRRRLLILTISMVLMSVLSGTLFMVHQWQSLQQYNDMRQKAEHAMVQGNFKQAIGLLSRCLVYWPENPQLLSDFTQAQMLVTDQAQRYIELTIDVLLNSASVNPQHDQEARLLADMYRALDDQTQAINIATRILKEQPKNLQLLKYRTFARACMGQYEKAIADVDQCLVLKPDWHELYLLRLYFMKQLDMPAEPVFQTVASWQKSLNHVGWYQALMGVICRQFGMDQQALNWFVDAQDQTQNDGRLLSLLVGQFDAMGEYVRADQLLNQSDPKLDTMLLYQKAWRAWQNQQDEVLGNLPEMAVPQVLALQVMSLRRTKQVSQIQAKLSRFKLLPQSRTTVIWEQLLGMVVAQPQASPIQIIELAQQVRRESRMPGLANVILAQQWEKLGEQSCALDTWKRLAHEAPAWELPHLQQARIMLAMGHSLAGAASARQAIKCNPKSITAAVLLIEALTQVPQAHARETAIALFDEISPKLLGDTQIRLACRVFETTKANEQINEALKQKVHWNQQTWIELAKVSLARGGNWHLGCLSEYKKRYGVDPQWLRLSALSLGASGELAAGRRLIESQISRLTQRKSKPSASWLIAQAQFLANLQAPLPALQAYEHLLKQYPQNLAVAQAVLDAPSRVQQLALQQQAVDQLRRLTGD